MSFAEISLMMAREYKATHVGGMNRFYIFETDENGQRFIVYAPVGRNPVVYGFVANLGESK